MNNILEVEGLGKDYRDFSLSNVCFTLPEDCIAGFVGINGAGKTTTIRTILGLAKKSSGTVRMFGKDFSHNETEIKNRIGVVLDEGYFYDDLSMAQMKGILAPAYSNWNEKAYLGCMERFSLDPRQKIATLSRGMRMKFALTLALSHDAELLIMDEPTSGLDPFVRSQFLDIIADFMQQGGKGVLFSTHITSDLDKIADVLIMIHEGRIVLQQEKDWLLESHRLVKGDRKLLDEKTEPLLLNFEKTDFGFSGITNQPEAVHRSMPGVITEKPTIEDIMLGYIGGEK
ncbi:MAG: ABC transporter ATP-binding protein [Clostridiales bacterium]|nr:ABC transporter ATP-binding protein [Clostridiales bacterium]